MNTFIFDKFDNGNTTELLRKIMKKNYGIITENYEKKTTEKLRKIMEILRKIIKKKNYGNITENYEKKNYGNITENYGNITEKLRKYSKDYGNTTLLHNTTEMLQKYKVLRKYYGK